jgi:hypothetical protein
VKQLKEHTATRGSKHAAEERTIFDAFLTAHPAFATTIASFRQPDAEFPDMTVTLKDGSEIDFELAEWLHGEQMCQAKRRERLVESIENTIGDQSAKASAHLRAVMMVPRNDLPRFDPKDAPLLGSEMWALIGDTDQRWPSERHWHSPQGRHVREFDAYPTLNKYLSRIVFEPLVVAGRQRERRPKGLSWIFAKLPVRSYSPDTALDALGSILLSKIDHYGGLSRPVRLLVYYGKAIAYNTPWHGLDFREFRDVAEAAASIVGGQSRFENIYLLSALQPGLEAFEIFPQLVKCQ